MKAAGRLRISGALACLLTLALLAGACGKPDSQSKPSAMESDQIIRPSGGILPVTVYAGPDYTGRSAVLEEGDYALSSLPGFESGIIAGVRIPAGSRLLLYRSGQKGGGFLSLEEDEPDLTGSGWASALVSVRVGKNLPETDEAVLSYNYVLGTQAFNPLYGFSGTDRVYEAAKRIWEMGSNVIKLHDKSDYDAILRDFDFRYVYLWLRTDTTNWRDGLSATESELEYDAVYEETRRLLREYDGSGKTFYLGHWEGDWYLIDNYDANQTLLDPDRVRGMIGWLNIRQQAIDDAKRDTPHDNVQVYGYTEANRTADIASGAQRLANTVLPYVNIDYLSYSAYDIQGLSAGQIKAYLDQMEGAMPPRDVPGPRVFIGETGLPAVLTENREDRHNAVNAAFFRKYFEAGVPQILYWQMYNNEQADGKQQGYWLIDNRNHKWKLYYTFKAFYGNAREYVRDGIQQNGAPPGAREFADWAAAFLETMQ